MAGPGDLPQSFIIGRPGVVVPEYDGKRSARGVTLENAAEKLRFI